MILSRLERFPPLRPLVSPIREWRARRHFAGQYAAFHGVFTSRAEAERSAPSGRPLGSASAELVAGYSTLLDEQLARRGLDSYEYPVLFWLSTFIEQGDVRIVADFGGNLGTHYYGFARYLEYPPDLEWHIVDVPPIAAEGSKLATARAAAGLHFATTIRDVPASDVLIASGVFQYLDDPLSVIADAGMPAHVLVNRLPLGARPSFWTLQNGGEAYYAQQIQSRGDFLAGMTRLGYARVDEWDDRVDRCELPLNPDHSVSVYSGFYFRRGA